MPIAMTMLCPRFMDQLLACLDASFVRCVPCIRRLSRDAYVLFAIDEFKHVQVTQPFICIVEARVGGPGGCFRRLRHVFLLAG
jgi:hypothetical protein